MNLIGYKISNNDHYVTFCKKNSLNKISHSLIKIKSDKNVLFIYDDNVQKKLVDELYSELKLSGCNIVKLKCEGYKKNKNEKLLFKILDLLLRKKFTKSSIIISFGGGVIGDVSALASSLYLRGMNYYCIPTTMTSIVDSSIGGKTAINYKGIINTIGTYYHPKNVFILEQVIETLPDREFFAGISEIIKCGIIENNKILNFLKKNRKKILDRDISNVFKICSYTLKAKIKFFQKDIYEKNTRLNLNFGHTFAHAIEMALDKQSNDFIRHGEAVGLGILCELFYANKKKNKIFNETQELLQSFNLPTKLNLKKIPYNLGKIQNEIYKNVFLDKKKLDKNPRYICVRKIGKPKIKEVEDHDFINDTIHKVLFSK